MWRYENNTFRIFQFWLCILKTSVKIATSDKLQFDLTINGQDIGNWMLTLFPSNHCILSLLLRIMNQAKNTVVHMARLLSSNGYISLNFDTIPLKLSTHAWFMVLFHSKSGVSKLFATGARFSIVKVVGAKLFTYSNDNLTKIFGSHFVFHICFFCFNFNILRMFLVHLKQAYHVHLNIHLTFFLKQK